MNENSGALSSKASSNHLTTWPSPFSVSKNTAPQLHNQVKKFITCVALIGKAFFHVAHDKAGLNPSGVLPESALPSESARDHHSQHNVYINEFM